MRAIFPEAWRDFAEHLPAGERTDLLSNYYRRLIDRSPDVHRPAARAWSRYEAACSTLYPTARAPFESDHGGFALALSRIEAHYFRHNTFLTEGWPWNELNKVRNMPCTIVQGRYDIVCPPITAEALSRAWPEARFVIVPDAGHSALEPGIRAALVNATESYRLSVADDQLFAPRFPWEAA
jgi:proline iminopeptidase